MGEISWWQCVQAAYGIFDRSVDRMGLWTDSRLPQASSPSQPPPHNPIPDQFRRTDRQRHTNTHRGPHVHHGGQHKRRQELVEIDGVRRRAAAEQGERRRQGLLLRLGVRADHDDGSGWGSGNWSPEPVVSEVSQSIATQIESGPGAPSVSG